MLLYIIKCAALTCDDPAHATLIITPNNNTGVGKMEKWKTGSAMNY